MSEDISDAPHYTEVLPLSAISALETFPNCKVWIASRAREYALDFLRELIKLHPTGKLTLILITEGDGGCCEPEEFFELLDDSNFEKNDSLEDCNYYFPMCAKNDYTIVYVRND